MKITFKTLQQKTFQIDAEGSDTIADLKAKISETQNHPVEAQKIIFSGKVLPDSKTIESCEIKEKDFLVLMVSKPKAAPVAPKVETQPEAASAAQPAASTSDSASSAPSAPTAAAPSIPAPNPPTITPAVPQSERAFGDMSSFLSGDALQSSINNMIEMGFPREQVMQAMRASYNNPDRAVEYLMTGIPDHLIQQQAQAAEAGNAPAEGQQPQQRVASPTLQQQPAAAQPATTPAPGTAAAPQAASNPRNLFQMAQQQQQQQQGAPGAGANPLGGMMGAGRGATAGGAGAGAPNIEALRNNPQFAQIRELAQTNPALLQGIIQQFVANNPGLAQTINQNPEALLNLLGGMGGEGMDEEGNMGGHAIAITEEENAAIERLTALGFTRQQAAEAYLACDKNEELAANYLFENGFEDQ